MYIEPNADKDLCLPRPLSAAHPPTLAFTARLRDRDTGAPLAGGEYGLFQGGVLRCAAVSDGGGALAFHALAPGDYHLRELAPPTGYLACAGVYRVCVTAGTPAVGPTLHSVFLPRLSFYLLDAAQQRPLSGGLFSLSNGAQAVSNADGRVDFGLLPSGVYAVRQHRAPAGYLPLPLPLAVTVTPCGRVRINGQDPARFTAYNPPAS